MKKYLFITILLASMIWSSQAQAALMVFVSSSTASSTSGVPTTLTTGVTTTVNNALAVFCTETGGGSDFSTSTATSSDGIVFTNFANSSGSAWGEMYGYYGLARSTGRVSSTCSFGGAPTDMFMLILNYSGNEITNYVDTTSSFATNANITSSTNTYSTTVASDTIVQIGYAGSDGSLTSLKPTVWTTRGLSLGLFGVGYGDLSTSTIMTNRTTTWTFSASPFVEQTISFKSASAGHGEGVSHFNVRSPLTMRRPINIDQ